jgi:Xaa-Pro aminopeptidase
MKIEKLTPTLFSRNRQKVMQDFKPRSVAILHANDELLRNGDQHFPYRQNSDLFYLTGLNQEKCILVLCPDHPDPNKHEILFTIKPNPVIETWTGHKYTKNEVADISGINNVKWLEDFEMAFRELALYSDNIYVNLNEYQKYQSDVSYVECRLTEKLKSDFPAHQFERLAPILTKYRMVKEDKEIEWISEACKITQKAFERVLQFVRPGVMEFEIEAEMTHEYLINGARGHAYQPIVGSGENALVLHYIENNSKCKDGDLLLMDFGAEYNNYAADCSRTIPVNGKFSARQKECYEAVLRVQKEATKLFVPGNTLDGVNKEVSKLMEAEMIKLGLFSGEEMKEQKTEHALLRKYLMHGVTHFIGLDVHDVGDKYTPFEKGMVLTIEPGLYIKEEKIGIRIENNIMVDDVPVDLTANIPREVNEIEEIMNQ